VDFGAFKKSVGDDRRPSGLTPALEGLWIDAHGDWSGAHDVVQKSDESSAAWVHAYLHRKEGDLSNAGYWYSRAGREFYRGSTDEEWELICRALLGGQR
jgi:hypothetical protein